MNSIFSGGNVTISIEKEHHHLKPGIWSSFPWYSPPCVSVETLPYQRFVFWISQDYCQKLKELSKDYVYLIEHAQDTHHFIYHYDVVAFNALSAKIFRLIEEIHADRFGKAAKIELCVNDLMLHINRAVYEAEHPAARKDASGLYDGILQYIESNLDEDLSLDSLSKAFL